MEALKTLGGGAFVHMTFQPEDTLIAGQPVLAGIATDGGVSTCTTTAAIGTLGLSVDTATATSATPITLIVNPDLVWRAKISGTAAADGAIVIQTCTTGSTTTAVEFDGAVDISGYDEAILWGYSGVNVGEIRSMVGTDADTATVVNLLSAAASGDEFLMAPRFPGVLTGGTGGVTLCTELTQVNGVEFGLTAAEFFVLDGEYRTTADDGINNSFHHLVSASHCLSGGATAV